MIASFTPNSSLNTTEKFLAEKLLELFFNKTLDSHRAKLNNPRWILIELLQVLKDWHKNKIKNFDKTIKPVVIEAIRFIEQDNTLDFSSVNKTYYKELLGNSLDNNYQQLSYATKLIIEQNQNYCQKLFDMIESEIQQLSQGQVNVEDLEDLNKLLGFVSTELINHGYSKGYLYSVVSKLFGEHSNRTFKEAFNELKFLSIRQEEDFKVVFKIQKLGGGNKRIDIKSPIELQPEEISNLSLINEKAKSFFSKQGDFTYFLSVDVKGQDYLSVIERAKKEIFTLIDLLHLGYPDNPFDHSKNCLVIGTKKRELTNIRPVSYIPDGYYKNNETLYDLLLQKISGLYGKPNLQKESLQKLVSAYRHLRLGRDADELEQKFINYWIGLEYIFSNYDINDTTIIRLKEYFSHAHSVAYIRRNLTEFHNDIKRLKLGATIPGFDDNLEYLKLKETYDFIISNYSNGYPLLAFRAWKYKAMISSSKELAKAILKHRTNLEWHLTRSYRIRNEIVHDAAIHLNIESITGNLKYYLTYILNGLIDYLDSASGDINMDGIIAIDDYFLLQEIRYNSLQRTEFDLNQLMAIKSATEIFS